MAENSVTPNTGVPPQGDQSVPSWLKKAQEANGTAVQPASNTPVVPEVSRVIPAAPAQENSPVKQILALKDHEEKAKFNDEGKQVLDNVTGSAQEAAVKKEEKELEGLTFEGEEETATAPAVIKTAPVPVSSTPAAVETKVVLEKPLAPPVVAADKPEDILVEKPLNETPDWLKNLSAAPQTVTAEEVRTEKVQTEILKSIEHKPEEKMPVSPEKEKTVTEPAATVVAAEASADKKVSEKTKEEAKAKGDLLANLTKGLLKAVETTKEEVKKGKVAGVDESQITLENFEMSKSAREFSKTATGQQKQKELAAEHQQLLEAEKIFQEGMATVRDLIAPSSMEINYDNLHVEGMYARTFMVYSYPRYLDTNWMSPIVNFDATMDIAQFIFPIDSAKIMRILSKKVTQMQSAMNLNAEKGLIRDPALETAYEDAEQLRTEIQRGQEKFFQFAMYITVYADELKKIDKISKQLESILGSKLILTKKANLRMEHGFYSTSPMGLDELEIHRNMNTGPLSTTFPFSSSDLTSNEGILYGLNRHNDSLVIFDRFSLPNANSVVFAISGAGKSYSVKLEIVRYLMMGVDILVIDPENEYEELTKTVGGSYLRMSLTSDRRINPFDLPAPLKDEELQPGDLLRSNIINLHGLLKIMLGGINPMEEGIIDKALNDVYALKGITMEMIDPSNLPVPTMEDLHALLLNMEGAAELAQRLEKYTKGTYSGIFNKPTNIDVKSGLMVFSIRDLEDALRPIAMYIILNFIWNKIRSALKKRLMIVDEAWTMMQHEDSAKFLFGLVKRARKYYLGITVINQDVEDFMKSPYGKPIVSNSAMSLLLKQSPASIAVLQKTFNLTEGEKYMLLNSGVGQGLFFAGMKHVAIQVIASYMEDKIVTTNPEEILRGLSSTTTETYE
jgi:hypothetical protein